MDAVGWAAILPQMLASLGAVFALAGVGDRRRRCPAGHSGRTPCWRRAGLRLGMALFTMMMGNAFAAFPVMIGGGRPALADQAWRRSRRSSARSACWPASAAR